ncbi:hypothetical protein PHYSODRAFT_519908 [Phytophthora sojae]|uniref:Uncharacterized protein n=1 Tax=Phytophthora sojae (strain P6497) TaxID=1094619 RepID=G5A281_PHYSP|nr:hypothetical protein PHYSODRAFT_519908 [Phytophthora sojae]EGZ11029.1 hypothetical protein PHYSODRAFT_519908 [Phytophthora sojae]|eukprot:XP_009533774.1 hypothetical protein PHYSODRAFT_519908 [Phytophthora sojae]
MWANFARSKFFTAGNTTTNRIESNWNQVKILLGHKTRIDKTIAGLVQHQIMITQQIGFVIAQHHSTSPKVRKEWERFVNFMADATCERTASSPSQWKIYCGNQTCRCHDVDRHLMHLAREGHDFNLLPAMAIHDRWSTYQTLEVKNELTAAAEMLQPIVQMSKLRLPKV